MTPEAIIAALLAIFPYMSGNNRQCIIDNTPRIVRQLNEVNAYRAADGTAPPPLELVAAMAFMETHLGCDPNEGGGCGIPIDARHRHTAGNHMSMIRVLVNTYRHCHNWDGAVMMFRTGWCNPARQSPNPRYRWVGPRYLRNVRSLVSRIQQHR